MLFRLLSSEKKEIRELIITIQKKDLHHSIKGLIVIDN